MKRLFVVSHPGGERYTVEMFDPAEDGGWNHVGTLRDTRFREDGLRVEPSSLHSSTRVFVRAGKNLDGEIEAYEIVWGEILTPARSR